MIIKYQRRKMPPTLKDPGIKREVKVYGVENSVIAFFSSQGIQFKAKGTKIGVTITWPEIVKACAVPSNMPSRFAGRPYEFLQYQALEQQKRFTKRLGNEITKEIQERDTK